MDRTPRIFDSFHIAGISTFEDHLAMKIVTYNVNGIRSSIKKGVLDWIEENQFDVVCLQETKAHRGSVPTLLIESLGYKHYWHSAQRKGYSGVATFCKKPPSKVYEGLGIEKYDR